MELVVGLGNPGPRYADTRHNIGFMVVDHLARLWRARRLPLPAEADVSVAARPPRAADEGAPAPADLPGAGSGAGGAEVLLVKPLTYMNLSGKALEQLRQVRSFRPEDVLIVVDDIYLPFGTVRLRSGGSDGGHNGLTSIHASLNTLEVPRLRCGVGPVPEGVDLKEFVLEPFTPGERTRLSEFIDRAASVVRAALDKGVAGAQNEVALANKGVADA